MKVGFRRPIFKNPQWLSVGCCLSGWWFQIFFLFHPYLGKMNPFWRAYFSDGLKPPTSYVLFLCVTGSSFFVRDSLTCTCDMQSMYRVRTYVETWRKKRLKCYRTFWLCKQVFKLMLGMWNAKMPSIFIGSFQFLRKIIINYLLPSLKLTFSQLKIDGWNPVSFPLWGVSAFFQGRKCKDCNF